LRRQGHPVGVAGATPALNEHAESRHRLGLLRDDLAELPARRFRQGQHGLPFLRPLTSGGRPPRVVFNDSPTANPLALFRSARLVCPHSPRARPGAAGAGPATTSRASAREGARSPMRSATDVIWMPVRPQGLMRSKNLKSGATLSANP